MNRPPRRAVVIGASIAGLLAARVLSEHVDEVLVIDRDPLPGTAAPRKGTPQARHAHGLLARGRQIIEQLLPGFTDSLIAQGAVASDIGAGIALQSDRRRFQPRAVGEIGLCASRGLIEAELRRRVRALPGVWMCGETDVLHPLFSHGRVVGVQVASRAADASTREPVPLPADLVIDCSGRGSRCPKWLRDAGYDAPEEDCVTVHVSYATTTFERDPQDSVRPPAMLLTATPGLPRPGVLLAQEAQAGGPPRWVLTLGGYGSDAAPLAPDAQQRRLADMAAPEMASLVRDGRPLGPAIGYRFPHSQRRRYERLSRFPGGLLVMGDALTSFNPIYGQGMTIAAVEALALRDWLVAASDLAQTAARPFFRAASRAIDTPWLLAVGGDLALPGVDGQRCPTMRLMSAYLGRLQRAAARDPAVTAAFARVMHMLAAPTSLLRPTMLWRVWRHGAADRPTTLPATVAPAA